MSEKNLQISDFTNGAINEIEIFERYGCPLCGNDYHSQELCNEHIAKCGTYITTNRSLEFSNGDYTHKSPKRKLLNPLTFILNENEAPCSLDKLDNVEMKKMKPSINLKQGNNETLENSVYCTTSKMLSENEMLITLPYDESCNKSVKQGNLSFMENLDNQSNIISEPNTFEMGYKHIYGNTENTNLNNENVEVIVENATILQIPENSIIIEKINSSDTENDSNMKTLIVLNPVKPNNKPHAKITVMPVSDIVSDSTEKQLDNNFIMDVEINSVQESNQGNRNLLINKNNIAQGKNLPPLNTAKSKQSFISKRKGKIYQKIWDAKTKINSKMKSTENIKKKTKKFLSEIKVAKNIAIDLEEPATPISKKLKQNHVVQTYIHKKKTDKNNIKDVSNQKMYQKISLSPKEDDSEDEVPNQLSVYDFYDEEEEKHKLEKAKRDKELQDIKARTCRHCKELFEDPIYLLRHKRKFHTPRKVLLSKEEIEPYLKLENRSHCPLCYKEICLNGYKSVYVRHLMTHCENSSFNCKVCGIKFKRKDHLQNHESRHVVPPVAIN